jgi:hypothetical protein
VPIQPLDRYFTPNTAPSPPAASRAARAQPINAVPIDAIPMSAPPPQAARSRTTPPQAVPPQIRRRQVAMPSQDLLAEIHRQPVVPPPVAVPPIPPVIVGGLPTGDEPEPSRRIGHRGIGWIVVLVLLVVIGVPGYFLGWPVLSQWPATIQVPHTLIGMQEVTDPRAYPADNQKWLEQLKEQTGYTQAIEIIYRAPGDDQHLVLVIATAGFVAWPGDSVNVPFDTLAADGAVTDSHQVSPGPMGGTLRCATIKVSVPLAVCSVADHGSKLVALFLYRTPAEAEVLTRAIRPELVHRRY